MTGEVNLADQPDKSTRTATLASVPNDVSWPLQRIDLAAPPEVRPLYVRVARGAARVDEATSSMHLDPGTIVSGDTYFASLPSQVWATHTDASIRLELDIDGHAEVRVLARDATERYHLLDRIDHHGGTACVAIDDDVAATAERLAFEVEAHGSVILRRVDWTTDQAAPREVRLGIVVCTFNRLAYLQRTIEALVAGVDESLAAIIVVNQGDPFDRSVLAPAGSVADALLTLVEQDNLGGCGGFSRGMVEVSRRSDITHFLLLDDDIVVETESVRRTIRLFTRATHDVAIGGHMLNLHRPLLLHEAGGWIDAATAEHHPLASGTAVDTVEGLDALIDQRNCDYNAWWYFAAPASVLDRHLPMPCFIRGDDIEFGVRLARDGVPTITLTGVAVWHEPFYLKRGGWHLYFDVVNRLALSAMHQIGTTAAVRRHLGWLFSDLVATAQYDQAALVTRAIEDFARGPEHVLRTEADRMHHCRELIDEIGPEQVPAPLGAVPRARRRPDADPPLAWGRSRKLTRLARGLVPSRPSPQVPVFDAADYDKAILAESPVYDVREPGGATVRRYRHDAATEWRLWRGFGAALRGLSVDAAWTEPVAADFADGWRTYWHERFPTDGSNDDR